DARAGAFDAQRVQFRLKRGLISALNPCGRYGAKAEGTWQMVGETGAADEIFIVDDDPAICGPLSIVLYRASYQPPCFSDGASLLAAGRVGTPACIVLDVHIPGAPGSMY